MGFTPDNSNSNTSTIDNSSSSGKFFPDEIPSSSTITQDNPTSGVVGTTLGAVGSGLMKGAEGMMQTAQGGANVIQGILNKTGIDKTPAAQDFSNQAADTEDARQKIFKNQETLHGKVLEAIGQLPSIIAQVGSGEGAGLLGMKGGATAFATQAALQTQPQTQGMSTKDAIGNMAWQATKAAAFGAVLGKASKMGPVAGPTLAATYSAGQSALEGGDPNDVLAGAITGAGLTILSNPKNLAYVWTGTQDATAKAIQGTKNILNKATSENVSPLGAASSIIGKKVGDWYQGIKDMNESPDRIAEIDQQIAQTKTVQQEEMDKIAQESAVKEQLRKDAILEQKGGTSQSLTLLEREKTDRLAQIDANTEQAKLQIGSQVDSLDKELSGKVSDIVTGLKKGGRISNLFAGISNAYESALNNMGEKLSGKSPITRLNMIDMLTASLGKISDSNYNVPSGTRITSAVNEAIDMMKNTSFKGNPEDLKKIEVLKKLGIPNDQIEGAMRSSSIKGGAKIDMNEEVPFGMAKSILTRIKNSDPYGSHEADIVRHTFGDMISLKLGENGQPSPEFEKLQSQMSDAISYKNRLAQVFALKQGIAYPEGGIRFLTDVASGKEGNPGLLKFLESGTEIAGNKVQGVGDISSQIKSLGLKLQSVQESFKNINAKEKAAVAQIGLEYAARMDAAETKGQLTQDRINLEHKRVMQQLSEAKDNLENNYKEQLKQLGNDKAKQSELLRRKTDIGGTINIMGLGVSAFTYKAGAALRLLGRLQAKKATGFGKRP